MLGNNNKKTKTMNLKDILAKFLKFIKTNTFYFIIAALLIFLCISVARCIHNKKDDSTIVSTVTHTVTTIDTVLVDTIIYKPIPVLEVVHSIDTTIDTCFVFVDYFTDRYYNYNMEDSNFKFNADILVNKNAIQTLKYNYEVYNHNTVTTTVVTKIPKFSLYLGGGVETNLKSIDVNLGIDVGIKRHLIGVDYSLIDKRINLRYGYNIFSR